MICNIPRKTSIKSHFVNLCDYQVIQEIARGGFGLVYLVQSQKDGRQFAAKVNLHNDMTASMDYTFISRELAILMRVEAPTIIRFRGFSLEDFNRNPNVTILMEYYENGSLRQLIEQEQKHQSPHEYDNTAKQIILCGIAHGMMTLHSRRVLHRDLKPANILLDGDYHPYITDFGLSKFLDPTNSKSQSMEACGTASYMSPELILGTHYNTKSDVYSFGILMYEVLTGEFAFSEVYKKKNFNPFQITHRVANGERPTFKGQINPSFQKLIERCWSQEPKERPTFEELFHKLSLSDEYEDDTLESSLRDMISKGKDDDVENHQYQYLLDNVNTDRLFEYIYEITAQQSREEVRFSFDDRTTQINALIEPYQQEIIQIKAKNHENKQRIEQLEYENQQNQQEIEYLKSQLDATNERLNQLLSTTSPSEGNAEAIRSEPTNPFEYLPIHQIASKVQREKLTQITIPSTVVSIERYAFSKCRSLKQITIPSTVVSIGDYAFFKCSSLKQITIPSSVTSIGNDAFSDCSSLTQITIPSSVTSIGNDAFYNCSSLTQITIPSSVTSIGNCAFSYCSSLTQITIPSSVTSIGNSAFSSCSSFTQITIPSSVTSIGNCAFYNCSSLTQITIPSSVTSIGEYAFYGCNLSPSIGQELQNRFGTAIIYGSNNCSIQ